MSVESVQAVFSSVTAPDVIILMLFLQVWVVGTGWGLYLDDADRPLLDRIHLETRQYVLLTLAATLTVWLTFALGSNPFVQFEENPDGIDGMILVIIFCYAAVWVGFHYAGGALTNLRLYLATRRADAVDAGDAESGRVRVSGTVQPAEGTIRSPLTGTEAVYYDVTVERECDDRNDETVSVDEDRVRFVLEDETGQVLVDPEDALLLLQDVIVAAVPGDDSPEDSPARSLAWKTEYEPTDCYEVFRETSLEPGDRVTIIGVSNSEASEHAESQESLPLDTPTIAASETGSDVVVAPRGGWNVDWYFATTIVGCAIASVVLTGAGFAVLLALT